MRALWKEILRWAAIVLFGGFGLWKLFWLLNVLVRCPFDWFGVYVFLFVTTLMVAPPLAVAYCCWRFRYRKIFNIVGVVGAFVVFWELMALPRQLGIYQLIDHRIRNGDHSFGLLGLPLALLFLLGPAYVAAWFFRASNRLSYAPGERPRPAKTQSTRWLVLLGLCCVLFSMLAMVFCFNLHSAALSSSAPSTDTIERWLSFGGDFFLVGLLLMFLGLVRRRPIAPLAVRDIADRPGA